MVAGWCSRTVRAALFAAVCVLLAALGHVMMSGTQVPGWTLALALGATGGIGWCLAGRERGLALVVSVAVVTQTLLHTGFSLAQSAVGGGASGAEAMDMSHIGHVSMGGMGSMDTAGSTASNGAMDAMGALGHLAHLGHSDDGSSSLGMYAAHLLAALLSGVWLAFGERAVFRILRTVAGWLAAPLRLLFGPLPVTAEPPSLRPRRDDSGRAPRSLLLVHSITSRGPPAGTAVA
ncbi:hypothetical protein ACFXAZ_00155 [Streptomyces sp. NPDC059477]|uniref:hypothetical protein n=1 Tax=Streptomyces sp. NPDC059477 TaxID=3346847 RepID=UPI00368D4381